MGNSTVSYWCRCLGLPTTSSVYIVRNDNPSDLLPLTVAQSARGHFTADMHWGSGKTKNMLFASSACLADGKGYHRAFDIVKCKAVMRFQADEQACSTLTVDSSG